MPLANRYQQALLSNFAERRDAIFCRQIGDAGETILTWGDLERECGRFGSAYRASGLRNGDQALIFLRHVPELYGAFLGAILVGVTPAFMPCTSPRQDPQIYWHSHQILLERIRPAAIVTDRATAREMEDAGLSLGECRLLLIEDLGPAPLNPIEAPEDAIALLQHSSGTTGLKKGVALSFGSIVRQVESYAAAIDLRPDDVIVSWLPLYHDMGLIACLILPAYFGIPVTHLDPFHWIGQPATLFDRIVADRGTLSWLPNFAFEHLAAMLARRADRWDLSGMRAFINCSEPCKPTSFDRFASTFSRSGVRSEQLQCCYAMAETVFAVSQTRIGRRPARLSVDPERLGIGDTVQIVGADSGVALIETGQPISGISVSIHTDAEGELGDGRVGEVRLRGDFLFTGYNRDPELTAARLRDGCYASRDLGFTRDGSLYVLGRMDDLIIVNGRNLFAHEVEAVVNQVAGVKAGRAVALAWFDQRVGSHALVIMAERARGGDRADADIRHDVMTVVHSVFNVAPKAVQLLEEGRLVKTSSGKISRSDNLKRFNAVQQSLKAAEQP